MIRLAKQHGGEVKTWLIDNQMPSSVEEGMGGYQNTISVELDHSRDEAMFRLRFSDEISDCPAFDVRAELQASMTIDYYRYMNGYKDNNSLWRYDPSPFSFGRSFYLAPPIRYITTGKIS